MSYQEMTRREWDSISARLGGDEGWRRYYWTGSPPWWQPIAFYKHHTSDNSRWLRQACLRYGGFDPFYPLAFAEF